MKYKIYQSQGTRSNNLDHYIYFKIDKANCFILADGYDDSELQNIDFYINTLKELIINNSGSNIDNILTDNLPINSKMAIIIAIITINNISIISVGDCRAYVNGDIITDDDSKAWNVLSRRGFDNKRIATLCCSHPYRHILTDSIKPGRDSKNTIKTVNKKLKHMDKVIICTDGVWKTHHNEICLNKTSINYVCKEPYTDNCLSIELYYGEQ